MILEILPVGPLQVNCAIVACPATQQAAVIDAGGDAEGILAAVERLGVEVVQLINTHGHFDHQGAVAALQAATGAPFALHRDDLAILQRAQEHAAFYGLMTTQAPDPDHFFTEGDLLAVGSLRLRVIHTPGHSPGGVCLLVEGEGHLFSGDTLFAGSIGRTDLPMGDHELLIRNIEEKLLVLPDETIVHPGHGPDTTIGREKRINPFLT